MVFTTTPAPLRGALLTAALLAGSCGNSPAPPLKLASLHLDLDVTGIDSASVRVCGVQMPPTVQNGSCISDLQQMTGQCPCFNALDEISFSGLCPTEDGSGGQWRFDYTVYSEPNCLASSAVTGSDGTNPNNFVGYDSMHLAAMSYPNASVEALALGTNDNRIICTTENARKLWSFEVCETTTAAPRYQARYDCGCVPSGGGCSCASGVGPSDLGADCKFESNTCQIVCGPPCTSATQCNDGLACTDDLCINGLCSNTSNCNDGDQCTLDTCTSSGVCSYMPIVDGRPCGIPELNAHCGNNGCEFPCENEQYIITIDPTPPMTGSTLNLLTHPAPGVGALAQIARTPAILNALGYHPTKHVMYTIAETGAHNLWQIRADGSYTELGTITNAAGTQNLPDRDWFGGTFMRDGTYLIVSSYSFDQITIGVPDATVAYINVDTRRYSMIRTLPTTGNLILIPLPPFIIDIAVHPDTSLVWAYNHPLSGTGTFVTFNPMQSGTGQLTLTTQRQASQSGVQSGWLTGAAVFDLDRYLYFYGSNRMVATTITSMPPQLYLDRFTPQSPWTTNRILTGPTVDHSDGASCVWPDL